MVLCLGPTGGYVEVYASEMMWEDSGGKVDSKARSTPDSSGVRPPGSQRECEASGCTRHLHHVGTQVAWSRV